MSRPTTLCYWPDQDCICLNADHPIYTNEEYDRLEAIAGLRSLLTELTTRGNVATL